MKFAVANGDAVTALREDLRLYAHEGPDGGDRCIMVYDPAKHSYFRLAGDAVEVIARWGLGSLSAIRESIRRECGRDLGEEYIAQVQKFVTVNELGAAGTWEDSARLVQMQAMRRRSLLTHAVHNYLFFRLPLLRPGRWLERATQALHFCFAWRFWIALALLGVAGIYLVSREWEAFARDVAGQARWASLPVIALVLLALKAAHEFGHAVVATRMGCRVPSMGVAFMVLTPVFYTDTTDAWRLPSKKARIAIVCAGVAAEMAAAVLAIFLWPFLPEGIWRQIAVTVAVAAPTLSLLINLNPFMRFDGYFLLMDVLGVENLQARAFAHARWRLREILFAPGLPPPENFSPSLARTLILWSWCTWVYRLMLFTGIAIFVYAFFIKLLGIILFLIEIGWFVVLPIWREAKAWWVERDTYLSTPRAAITGAAFLAILALAFLPLSTTVRIPAILTASEELALHPQVSGRVAEMGAPDSHGRYTKGALVLRLESPDLETEARKTQIGIDLLELRLARLAGDPQEQQQLAVLERMLVSQQERLKGLQRMRDDLSLLAPVDGVLADLEPDLHTGRWLRPAQRVATMIAGPARNIRALAAEVDVARIREGDEARFIPDDAAQAPLQARVAGVAPVNEPWLFHEALAQSAGGSVPAVRDASGRMRPLYPVFAVRLITSDQPGESTYPQSLRGVAVIEGRPESFATMVWRRIARVAIRESGF